MTQMIWSFWIPENEGVFHGSTEKLTVADGDELGASPDESVHLDAADVILHLLEVGLIVPGLDVENDGRLGDGSRLKIIHKNGTE